MKCLAYPETRLIFTFVFGWFLFLLFGSFRIILERKLQSEIPLFHKEAVLPVSVYYMIHSSLWFGGSVVCVGISDSQLLNFPVISYIGISLFK